jgi:hypothetical protein
MKVIHSLFSITLRESGHACGAALCSCTAYVVRLRPLERELVRFEGRWFFSSVCVQAADTQTISDYVRHMLKQHRYSLVEIFVFSSSFWAFTGD